MKVSELLAELREEANRRAYIRRLDLLEQSSLLLKARLYLSTNLFIQIYRNDRFNTTNFVVVYNGERIYGRDQLSGSWHRHPANAPYLHDTSAEGSRQVNLAGFLDEVEAVLAKMDLP